MLDPIMCFTCGNILGGKWDKYYEIIKKYKKSENLDVDETTLIDSENLKVTPEKLALEELKIKKICCRRMMLSNCNLYQKII